MMARRPEELKSTGYEIFIGMLSILSIVNLLFVYVLNADNSLQDILQIMNALLSAIFLGDFIFRFFTAGSKGGYFFRQFGWADLLASLPLPQFKILRVFRLFRVYRLMAELGVKRLTDALVKDRAGSALYTLLFAGIMVLEFGSLAMLRIEEYAPNGNIKTASDALWYVIVTISTVGYGDFYATTNVGRLVGALIIVIGVGIFGTFTGYLANFFLSPPEKQQPAEETAGDPHTKLEAIKALMVQQQSQVEELERMLGEQEV